jgi:hypothetical protein
MSTWPGSSGRARRKATGADRASPENRWEPAQAECTHRRRCLPQLVRLSDQLPGPGSPIAPATTRLDWSDCRTSCQDRAPHLSGEDASRLVRLSDQLLWTAPPRPPARKRLDWSDCRTSCDRPGPAAQPASRVLAWMRHHASLTHRSMAALARPLNARATSSRTPAARARNSPTRARVGTRPVLADSHPTGVASGAGTPAPRAAPGRCPPRRCCP